MLNVHLVMYIQHRQSNPFNGQSNTLAGVRMNDRMSTELFGGADRYKALKCIFQNPGRHFGARELAAEAHIDPGNASRWLRRWAEAGLLEKTLVLNMPRYAAAADPALKHLSLFFQQDSDMVRQLRDRVGEIGVPVDAAVVFGSTAKGTAGADSDIDVLLLTDMPRLAAQTFFKPVARKLGRPVNVLVYKTKSWKEAVANDNPLAIDILGGSLIALKGDIHAIA
jgi:predicted nucleotidyltransferase